MKQVCRKRSSCRRSAATTSGARWPAFRQPIPPAKSMKRLPSTSSTRAPSARSTKMGVICDTPLGTASVRRRIHSWERRPGTEVCRRIADILIPPDRLFVQIDVNLLGLEIFFDAPWPKLATEAGLFIPAPRSFHISRLHVIDPHHPDAQRLDHAERLENISRPYGCGQTIRGVVGDADGFRFVFKGNYGGDRPEDFFPCDAGAVVHVAKDRRLHVVALIEARRPASAGRQFGFLLA